MDAMKRGLYTFEELKLGERYDEIRELEEANMDSEYDRRNDQWRRYGLYTFGLVWLLFIVPSLGWLDMDGIGKEFSNAY